jgi:hypothetical protein
MLLIDEELVPEYVRVLDCSDMAKDDHRFGDFEKRLTRLETLGEPPRGWTKLLPGVVLTVFVGWAGWLSLQVVSLNRENGSLSAKVDGLREKADGLRNDVDKLLTPERVKALVLEPPTKQNFVELQREIVDARERKVVMDKDILEAIWKKAAQASFQSGEISQVAWKTFVGAIEYKSSMNAWQNPKFSPRPIGEKGKACFALPENPTHIIVTLSQSICSGSVQQLDGGVWLDSLFVNSIIIYRGGPVGLRNVAFENCIFRFELTPRARELGAAIAATSPVTKAIPG